LAARRPAPRAERHPKSGSAGNQQNVGDAIGRLT
jgi:hypothetical protein